jgi:hypothetical protein
MSILDKVRRRSRHLSPLRNVGFHGDKHLLRLVDIIMQPVNSFIETGTNVGSTLIYMARTYPDAACYSCEPDLLAYREAVKNGRELSGVHIYNETSQMFFQRLEKEQSCLFEEAALFWLDAHGYGFKWPLREEVNFITTKFSSAYMLIDDFKVPGLSCFGFDSYKGQECSLEYIKSALNPERKYDVYYPAYTEKTSHFHSLRGWGLIMFGQDKETENYLDKMGDKIQKAKWNL